MIETRRIAENDDDNDSEVASSKAEVVGSALAETTTSLLEVANVVADNIRQ